MLRRVTHRARRALVAAAALPAALLLAGCGQSAPPPPEVGLRGPEAAAVLPPRTTAVLAVDLRASGVTRARALELALRLRPALEAGDSGGDDDGGDPLVSGLIARRAEAGRWATGQLALALAPGGTQGTAYVLAARDARAAQRTVGAILPGARRRPAGGGAVRLDTRRSHALVTRAGVVFGDRPAVDAVARHVASGATGLAAAPSYRRAMTGLARDVPAVLLRPATATGGALPPARVDLRLPGGGVRASVRVLAPDGLPRTLGPAAGVVAARPPARGVLAQASSTDVPGLVDALAGLAGPTGGTSAAQAARRLATAIRRLDVRVSGSDAGLRSTVAIEAPDAGSARTLAGAGRGYARGARPFGGGTVRVRAAGSRVLVELRTPYAGARAPDAAAGDVVDRVRTVTGAPAQVLLLPRAAAPVLGPLLGAGPGSRTLARAFDGVGVAAPGGAVEIGLAYAATPPPAPPGGGRDPLERLIPASAPAERRSAGRVAG